MGQRWKVVAAVGAGLVILLATLPWWLGSVLVPVARMRGLSIGSYQRMGAARFALHRVHYSKARVTVRADRLEADTPVVWLWRHLRGGESPVVISGWSVTVAPAPPRRVPSKAGFVSLRAHLLRISGGLRRWLPEAHLAGGTVRWPKGGFSLAVADWNSGVLTARGFFWLGRKMEVRADFPVSGPIAVRVAEPSADWNADLAWQESTVSGRLRVWSQDISLAGSFAPVGWLPAGASAAAPALDFPATRAGLGAAYERVQGGGRLQWRDGSFRLSVQAAARAPAGGKAPPLTVVAEAEGTRSFWTVKALDVRLPGAEAHLSQPVVFRAGRRAALNPARLAFSIDLEKIPLSAARGKARGWVEVSAKAGPPSLAFSMELSSAAWRSWSVEKASLAGALQWPRLTLASAVLDLDAQDQVAGKGSYDFHAETVQDARVEGRLSRPWLARLLPPSVSADSATFTVQASGELSDLAHRGTLQAAGVHWAPLRPLALRAVWQGRGPRAERIEAHLTAGATGIDAVGAADRAGARLTDLRFSPGGATVWRLQGPATIAWLPLWRVDHLRLAGGETGLALDLNDEERGGGSITVSHFPSAWCRDLLAVPGVAWEVRSLRMDGRMPAGRLVFSAQAEVEIKLPAYPAGVALRAHGEGAAIYLDEAALSGNGQTFARAQGRFPIGWEARARPHWRIDEEAPLSLQVATDPASPLWAPLARSFGLVLSEPRAEIKLTGTLRHPLGEIDASLGRLSSARLSGPAFPALENLALRIHANPTEVIVDSFTGRIAGQPLRAAGHWPIGPGGAADYWRAWNWRNAEAQLEVTDADLAPLAAAFPKFLAPLGRWDLRLTLARGDWSGSLKVRDAATRPSTPFGLIQAIRADATMADRTLEVHDLSASLGGQTVRIQGRAVFPAGKAPQFTFTLQGDNIPFVRRPDMLMRADFRLRADPAGPGGTLVSGTVNLRDGLFLADLTDLLPSGASGVSRPPPYFAVEIPPFNRWQLAVDLAGDRTIRIRTALFHGEASARFRVTGTLGEPRAIGEARIDQGQILLPFATFEVQIGAVRLTAVDPFTPQVDVVATAERYDYDLRMQAVGPADSPTITFTSSPALPSDQVLLLVMTGQVPTLGVPLGGTSTQVAGLGAYLGQGLFQGSGSSRLGVISGQQISDNGKPTYEIDYKLNDRWSLVGEYDQFDDYNAGVKWRVFRRGEKNAAP